MSIFIHEVDDIDELHAAEAEYAGKHAYLELYRTANSVVMRQRHHGIWWLACLAVLGALIMFLVRANAFEWQPLIAASVAGGSALIVWALAILGSIIETPLVEIKITGHETPVAEASPEEHGARGAADDD